MIWWIVSLLLVLWTTPAQAQLWSGILAPNRAVDWGAGFAGAGVIPVRPVCQTLNPGVTAAQITTALNNCPVNQAVKLNPGTFNLSGDIKIPSNRTLKGSGP